MTARTRWLISSVVVLGVIALAIWVLWPQPSIAPTDGPGAPITTPEQPSAAAIDTTSTPAPTKTVRAADITGADPAFTFAATIPINWQAEAVAATNAISLFDPAAPNDTTLEQSQIFIRFFRANDFLTLDTVTINNQQTLVSNGRPAVRYDITKKPAVTDFVNQPGWRSQQHIVTDIRVSDTNPSIFYVIAKRPDLDLAVYEAFLQSLIVDSVAGTVGSTIQSPVDQVRERVTKKQFGTYVTPANSPVQPERFTGYHTGIDVEYDDVITDVPVRAVAEGTVIAARTVSGYGGVVGIQHTIDNNPVVGIYGHLRPESLPTVGATVAAGEQIAVLGTGQTAETDGERKHLHFGLHRGTTLELRGYVTRESDLTQWLDPLKLLE